jgi:hypothetical protein
MFETIWLAGMFFANLWGMGGLGDSQFGWATPIPLTPWVADRIQERNWQVDQRVPILPPLRPGERPLGEAPSHAEILRTLPPFDPGVAGIAEVSRDELEFVVEKLVDRVDAPRFFPLIGPAQLHHCHWKCTVYFTEQIEVSFPYLLQVKRRRAEVVYIDRDRLHLCVGQSEEAPTPIPAAPASCPAGCVRTAKESAKAAPAKQIQIGLTVAQLDRSKLPDDTYRWALKQLGVSDDQAAFGVVKNQTAANDLLRALRADGFAKIAAEPTLITLSGQQGTIISGGQVPWITRSESGEETVAYKDFGIKVTVTPKIQADGKILMNLQPEVTTLKPGKTENGASAFDVQTLQVTAQLDDGQTLVIRGLTQREPARMFRMPILADFPAIADLFTWELQPETTREWVVLATPTLIDPYDSHRASPPPATKPRIIRELKIDRDGQAEECTQETAKTVIGGAAGTLLGGVVGAAQERREARRAGMTIGDVARMAKKGIAQDIIIRQIELTNPVFNLAVDDIIELYDQGVTEDVIRVMQERCTSRRP